MEGNFGHLGDRLSMVSFEEQDSFAKATIEMQLHPAAQVKKNHSNCLKMMRRFLFNSEVKPLLI